MRQHVTLSAPVVSLLTPAFILPAQWARSLPFGGRVHGELALMRAVLDDAIRCFQQPRGRKAVRLAHEAERWLFSDQTRWPFAFLNICAALGLDAAYLRRGLRRWQQRPVSVHL